MSAGLYSKSASWIRQMSPVAAAIAVAHCSALAFVFLVADKLDTRLFRRQLGEDFTGTVGAAIVDNNHLQITDQRIGEAENPPDGGLGNVSFVVNRHQHGKPESSSAGILQRGTSG